MKSTRSLRMLVALVALTFVTAACGNGEDVAEVADTPAPEEDVTQPDLVEGDLHACADGLPVPDELSVVESGLVPTGGGFDACIASMQGTDSVEEIIASYRSVFTEAGWEHATEQEEEGTHVLRFTDPECGFLIVVTGEIAAEAGLVPPEQAQADKTVALAQMVDCDQMPPPEEPAE